MPSSIENRESKEAPGTERSGKRGWREFPGCRPYPAGAGAFRRFHFLPLLIAALLGSGAGRARAVVMDETVASVNGHPILLSEYQKQLSAVVEDWKKGAPGFFDDKARVAELKRKVLDQMVDNELLVQAAEKRKVKIHDRELENGINEVKERNFRHDENGKTLTDEQVESALAEELKKEGVSQEQFHERIRMQLMMHKVSEEVVRPKVKIPDDADAKAAFEKIKYIVQDDTSVLAGLSDEESQAYLMAGRRVKAAVAEHIRVAHILVKVAPTASMMEKTQALNRAKELKARIDKGEDLSDVAKKSSDDPESAARGGELALPLVRGSGAVPAEFEKAAFRLPVGDVSEPVETEFGYHLITVLEKKAAEHAKYDKIKDEIMQFLFQLRSGQELEKFVNTLRAEAHIEVSLPKDLKEAKNSKESKDH